MHRQRARASIGFLWSSTLLACQPQTAPAQSPEPPAAPVALFAYDRTVALDYQQVPAGSPDVTVDLFQVSFASPGGGRVTGYLAAPRTAGPHAGIVVMHGLPGTAQGAMLGQGMPLAARGAVVIAVDAPWARRGGLPDMTTRDSVEQVQLMHDLQRAVDVLLARGDVDPTRIAYVGGSYGGAMGALFMGIERRLKTGILFVPDGGLVAHFTEANGTPSGPLAGLPPTARQQWLAAMRPIEPIRFIALAAGTPILYQNGRQDQLVTNGDAAALHAAAPEPKTVRWYDAGHGLTSEAVTHRLAWLAQHVGIRP